MDFDKNKAFSGPFDNNEPGAKSLAKTIESYMLAHKNINTIVIALEAASVYSIHIASFLSSSEVLMPFSPYVYCVNPKMNANYAKSFIGRLKIDPDDAYLIADFARVGRIECEPWHGCEFIALKRLTRHRLHLADCITREKTYMVSNMSLKFSELCLLEKEQQPSYNVKPQITIFREFFDSLPQKIRVTGD